MSKITVYTYMFIYNFDIGNGRMFLSLPTRGLESNNSIDDIVYLDRLINKRLGSKYNKLYITDWKLISKEDYDYFDFGDLIVNDNNFKVGDILIADTNIEGLTKGKNYEIVPCNTDWGLNGVGILNDNKEVKLYNINCFKKEIKELSIKEIFDLAKEKHNTDTLPMPYIMRFFKNTKEAYEAISEAIDDNLVEKIEYIQCPYCYHLDIFDENNSRNTNRCSRCKSVYIADGIEERFKLINNDN